MKISAANLRTLSEEYQHYMTCQGSSSHEASTVLVSPKYKNILIIGGDDLTTLQHHVDKELDHSEGGNISIESHKGVTVIEFIPLYMHEPVLVYFTRTDLFNAGILRYNTFAYNEY